MEDKQSYETDSLCWEAKMKSQGTWDDRMIREWYSPSKKQKDKEITKNTK